MSSACHSHRVEADDVEQESNEHGYCHDRTETARAVPHVFE
jgi:hypothetical protein